jgi:hypothetical protein
MADKVQTRYGQCPVHGHVSAVRDMPGPSFPFIRYAVLRYRASRKPFACPTCGGEVVLD